MFDFIGDRPIRESSLHVNWLESEARQHSLERTVQRDAIWEQRKALVVVPKCRLF